MRPPRTRFTAPLVVTLAALPACVVTTPPPSSQPTPTNPPAPEPPVAEPTPAPTPTPEPTPEPTPAPAVLTRWTVYQSKADQRCYAAIQVRCEPKATCNPPPPRPLAACPADAPLDKPLTIEEQREDVCVLVFPAPDGCAANPACNPPRPRPIDCPS